MANNSYNNRIELSDGTVLMDLTGDTVTPQTMVRGTTAHDRSGASITGVVDLANAGTSTPLPDSDSGSAGSATSYAREDHVHPVSGEVWAFNPASTQQIASNTDLNSIIILGDYICQNNAVAATLGHLPDEISTGFRLTVLRMSSTHDAVSTKVQQIDTGNRSFRRYTTNNGSTWTDWLVSCFGTVPVAHGGTGQTTAEDAANALLNGLPTWSADPTDSAYFFRQDTAGSNKYGKITFSKLWNYIKSKITSAISYSSSASSDSSASDAASITSVNGNIYNFKDAQARSDFSSCIKHDRTQRAAGSSFDITFSYTSLTFIFLTFEEFYVVAVNFGGSSINYSTPFRRSSGDSRACTFAIKQGATRTITVTPTYTLWQGYTIIMT